MKHASRWTIRHESPKCAFTYALSAKKAWNYVPLTSTTGIVFKINHFHSEF